MTIDDYRRRQGWSYSEMARQLGAAHATVVRRWCLKQDDKRRLIPSQTFMNRIVAKTNGEVTANDFYFPNQ